MSETEVASVRKRFHIGQDWASVVIGFILILFVAVAGYTVSTPAFGGKGGWNGFQDIVSMLSSSALGISLILYSPYFWHFFCAWCISERRVNEKIYNRISFSVPAGFPCPVYLIIHGLQKYGT